MTPRVIEMAPRCHVGILFVLTTYLKPTSSRSVQAEQSEHVADGCHAAMLLAIPKERMDRMQNLAEGARKLPELDAQILGLASGGAPKAAPQALIALARAQLPTDQPPTTLVEYSLSLEHFLAVARSYAKQIVAGGAPVQEANAILDGVDNALAECRRPSVPWAARLTGAVELLIGKFWMSA